MRSNRVKSNLLFAWIASVLLLHTSAFYNNAEAGLFSPEQQDYLEYLVKAANNSSLAIDRTWQVLLHYRSNLLSSGVTSEVDGTEFFLAENGKNNPQAELDATLKSYFSPDKIGKEKLTAQCAFPARYLWLDSRLNFNPKLMPVQRCNSLELWREGVDPGSVSLIFASYFLNNPASMFGHTLLRFNRKENENTSLLDFAINYAAVSEAEDNPFAYAWKGLTGGYEGRFSITPYYDMVKQYNDIDNRDLWEYRLNLSPAQVDMMLLHFWEIAKTNFDYFFFRENCSYHLLSMLEVADPELHLRDNFWAWTLPTETIKQVASIPGLVESVTRRPSLSSRVEQSYALMTDEEKRYLKWMISSDEEETSNFELLPLSQQAMIIETAINFLQYQHNRRDKDADERKNKIYSLLLQRSQLPVSDDQIPTVPELVSPDKGHGPVRFEISGGSFRPDAGIANIDRESFVEFSIQPGFHDLLSPEDGHASNSQVNFLNLRMRYETKREAWRLQNFNLVDIISLYPISSLIQKPSWKIKVGWEHNQDNACADCTPFVLNPGVGLALQSNLYHREVYFAFLEVNLEFDHEFNSGHRAGFGATVGLLFDATRQWRVALIANRTSYTKGQGSNVSEIELRQRFYLSRNMEIIFDLKTVEDYREGKFGIAYYF